MSAPGMCNNWAVQVHYALGSRKRQPKAKVSVARRNVKKAGCLIRAKSRKSPTLQYSRFSDEIEGKFREHERFARC